MPAASSLLYAVLAAVFLAGQALAGPAIRITPEEHDAGDVEEGVVVSHEFKIENTGDAALNISRVKTSCGCTASEVEKKQLAPGGSTVLRVEYDSDRRPGRFKKKITVFSDDPDRNEAHVHISGFVKMAPGPRISINPDIIRPGGVEAGAEIAVEFSIENTGEMDLTVSKVMRMSLNENNQPDEHVVALDEPFTLKPGEKRILRFTATAPAGGMFRFVYSVMSNDPHLPIGYMRLLGSVEEKKGNG